VTRKSQSVFASWSSLSEIHVGKQGIVLCHYAMRVWPHSGHGAWQLYGHSHGNLPDDPLSLSMDVGIDSHGFCPWHFEEVQAIMKGKSIAGEPLLETYHAKTWESEASGSTELAETSRPARSRNIASRNSPNT
jgi:hypothetical protein